MQQSKAYVIKHTAQRLAGRACHLKASIATRKAEYNAYRYGGNRKPSLPPTHLAQWRRAYLELGLGTHFSFNV